MACEYLRHCNGGLRWVMTFEVFFFFFFFSRQFDFNSVRYDSVLEVPYSSY